LGEIAGAVEFSLFGSRRGFLLVPGDPIAFVHQFVVVNWTDRALTVGLSGKIVNNPPGSWEGAVKVNPTQLKLDRDARAIVEVLVNAPKEPPFGEAAVLRLQAAPPLPGKTVWHTDVELVTAETSGERVVWQLMPIIVSRPADSLLSNASPGTEYTFLIDIKPQAPLGTPVTLCIFLARFNFVESTAADWGPPFMVGGQQAINNGVLTTDLPGMHPGGKQRIDLRIHTPARGAAERRCTFSVATSARIFDRSTGRSIDLDVNLNRTFTIIVKPQ